MIWGEQDPVAVIAMADRIKRERPVTDLYKYPDGAHWPSTEYPDRIGDVTALGLDETLFCRVGRWRRQAWSTQIVDVSEGRLLDVVEGRSAVGPTTWLAARVEQWCSQIKWATLDLSGPYRKVFDTMLPDAVQVADPFHVIKLANTKVDETRRRVQNETTGSPRPQG